MNQSFLTVFTHPLAGLLIIFEAAFTETAKHALQELADNPEYQQYNYNISHKSYFYSFNNNKKYKIITEKQIYDPDYLKILSGVTFICSVLFRVLFDTRTAGLATIKFYAIFIEYAPNRTFAAKTACSPNVIERMPVDIHIHDCLISFSFR